MKAGHAGWKAIIPIYNYYIILKIVGRPGWWLILYFIPIVNIIIFIIVDLNLAKSFAKGTGFAVGLILLSIVFIPILGFGPATYVGPAAGRPQGDVIPSAGADGALAAGASTSMRMVRQAVVGVAHTTVLAMWSARHFRSRPDAMRTNETTSVMMPKIPVTMPPMTSRAPRTNRRCPVSGCHVRMPSTCCVGVCPRPHTITPDHVADAERHDQGVAKVSHAPSDGGQLLRDESADLVEVHAGWRGTALGSSPIREAEAAERRRSGRRWHRRRLGGRGSCGRGSVMAAPL